MDLLNRVQDSVFRIIIESGAFHYEFELGYPFTSGNGEPVEHICCVGFGDCAGWNTENMSTEEQRWHQIEQFLQENEIITNADVREMFEISAAPAKRVLVKKVGEGGIQKV